MSVVLVPRNERIDVVALEVIVALLNCMLSEELLVAVPLLLVRVIVTPAGTLLNVSRMFVPPLVLPMLLLGPVLLLPL